MHAVVADFEIRNAGACALARFEILEILIGVRADAPQLVQIGVVARRDDAAVAQQHGRRLDERAREQRLLGGVLAAMVRERLQALGRERCRQAAQLR